MFLTRMHINPARRGTRHLMGSPQRMHAAVMCAFPPGTPTQTPEGRVLWRVDKGNDDRLTLYVSSPGYPDLTNLVEQAGWPASNTTWEVAETKPLLERLSRDQTWMFRLTANPVHNVRTASGGRGKRLGHVTVGHQEQWLRDRASKWGFDLPEGVITVHSRRELRFARRTGGSDRWVTLTLATFDGLLRVTDADLLRDALTHGVGRAKGYGCGLITLAPR